jgi:hypothetical protein
MWLGDTNQRKVDNIKIVGSYDYPGRATSYLNSTGREYLESIWREMQLSHYAKLWLK